MAIDKSRSIAAYLWLFGWLGLGAGLLYHSLPQSGDPLAQTAQAAATARKNQPESLPIEQIRVGQRVSSYNPTDEEDLHFGRDVDPATWKKLTLKAPKKDATFADVVLLRPDNWLAEHEARVGGTVEISVPECGIEGSAEVLAIDPCPQVSSGSGQIVTGTYQHHSAHVIDITFAGEDESIGTTANHPFWSEDKHEFVRADQLRPGEQVRTLSGLTKVTSITPRDGPEPVYNLEVAVAHTYHVGDVGVLVHNGGGLPVLNPCFVPRKFPSRPGGTGVAYNELTGQGVYILRDSSGTIRYVGRGDAPERLLAHARPGSGKEDLIGEVLFNNNLSEGQAQSLEQELIQLFGGPKSINPNTPLRNRIQGVAEGNPNFLGLEFKADTELVIEALTRAGFLGRW